MHTPQVSTAATAVHRIADKRGTSSPTMTQHADSGRAEPGDGGDQPADRRRRRVYGMHDAQLGRRVGLHDRDGYCHDDDREPQPECIRRPPASGAAAPRSQHCRAQPLRQLMARSRNSFAPHCGPQVLLRSPVPYPGHPWADDTGAIRRGLALTRPSWPPSTSAKQYTGCPGNPALGSPAQWHSRLANSAATVIVAPPAQARKKTAAGQQRPTPS